MAAQIGATRPATMPFVKVSKTANGLPAARAISRPAPRSTSRTSTRRTMTETVAATILAATPSEKKDVSMSHAPDVAQGPVRPVGGKVSFDPGGAQVHRQGPDGLHRRRTATSRRAGGALSQLTRQRSHLR